MKHPDECIRCGACVEVCPVERLGGHAIVTFLKDPDARNYSVWLCSSCWRCHESCPVHVDIYGLMMQERQHEAAPAGYAEAYANVLACGLALPITQDELDSLRQAWDLEAVRLPPAHVARRLLGCPD
ncbi:MAG: 4Fe-4S binding protein [Chloroflexi bacterium]|nr:4Fe-4S binding protein [Chloroflexota bacterium]